MVFSAGHYRSPLSLPSNASRFLSPFFVFVFPFSSLPSSRNKLLPPSSLLIQLYVCSLMRGFDELEKHGMSIRKLQLVFDSLPRRAEPQPFSIDSLIFLLGKSSEVFDLTKCTP